MVDNVALTRTFVDLVSRLVSDFDISEMLHDLCDQAAEILAVAGAGVMLEDEQGQLRFVAASDETVRTIETLQVELGEGPCLWAYRTGEPVVVADLGSGGEQFPAFAARALKAGLRAVFSFPMRVGDERIGALNLYDAEGIDFSEEDRAAAQGLADVATTAILVQRILAERTRLVTQLQHALDSRIVVEQAKGKLSEQLAVPVGEAFEVLRRHARSQGRKLQDVAAEVMAGGLDLRPGSDGR